MSSRDTMLPSRGFEYILKELNRRLERASRRLDWNSAAQDVYVPGPLPAPVTDLDSPAPDDEADMALLAELTLDPGEWVIFGSACGALISPAATGPYVWPGRSGVRIQGGGQVLDETARFGWLALTPFEFPGNVVSAFRVKEGPAVVSLLGWARIPDANGTAEFSRARLSAVPC
jgi:hypothetical protein